MVVAIVLHHVYRFVRNVPREASGEVLDKVAVTRGFVVAGAIFVALGRVHCSIVVLRCVLRTVACIWFGLEAQSCVMCKVCVVTSFICCYVSVVHWGSRW